MGDDADLGGLFQDIPELAAVLLAASLVAAWLAGLRGPALGRAVLVFGGGYGFALALLVARRWARRARGRRDDM